MSSGPLFFHGKFWLNSTAQFVILHKIPRHYCFRAPAEFNSVCGMLFGSCIHKRTVSVTDFLCCLVTVMSIPVTRLWFYEVCATSVHVSSLWGIILDNETIYSGACTIFFDGQIYWVMTVKCFVLLARIEPMNTPSPYWYISIVMH